MEDLLRCALVARASEPLPGTAPWAAHWVLVEDHGPWGRDALQDGRLPASVKAHLHTQCSTYQVRYQAIRRPDRSRRPARAVFLVNLVDGWTVRRDVPVEDLLDLDLADVTRATPPHDAQVIDEPFVAVCTHGTRDACCALWGRPVVTALAARAGDAVWETSHTGGHRFAPNVLVFPTGSVHGGIVDVDAFCDATLANRIDLASHRGNAGRSQPAQTAEVAVRQRLGLDDPAAVSAVEIEVVGDTARGRVAFDGRDGPAEAAVVLARHHLPDAPVSCGADPVPRATWQVTDLQTRAR